MTNLHIAAKSKQLLQDIYELAAGNPCNFANECLLSKLSAQIGEDEIFTSKCIHYLIGKGLIETGLRYGRVNDKEDSDNIRITSTGIDLAES